MDGVGNRVAHKCQVGDNAVTSKNDLIVHLPGKPAADGGLPLLPLRVLGHGGDEHHELAEDLGSEFEQLVSGSSLDVDVACLFAKLGLQGRVDDRRVVGDKVEGRGEVATEPGTVRERRREDGPDEGDKTATGNAGETVGA